ncbi:MAG: HAMP domain-containing sensor histidine kinase, partial [Xanthomonadales bacterium]|nr:HAMP domain-containing sensor histidine kinase [Xanthomonadales bacterium]
MLEPRTNTLLSRHGALAGALLLAALVAAFAWLQYRWLGQLRAEEEARRRVMLRVAATTFQDRISGELSRVVTGAAGDTSDPLGARFRLDAGGDWQAQAGSAWRPATMAEVLQALGRPLVDWMSRADRTTGLWLYPPAVVNCEATCESALLNTAWLDRVFEEAAANVFAEFAGELRYSVTVTDTSGAPQHALHPADVDLRRFAVTDVRLPLLDSLPIAGPDGRRWLLLVNHGGTSLEAAVAASHRRNLFVGIGMLALLLLAVALVWINARRRILLAERQMFFMAGISHELRTPLAVIGSAADNLADGAVADPERARKYGQLIRSETRRLGGMIENVLQFSRSAAGPAEMQEIDPGQIVADALDDCRDALAEFELRLDVPDNLPMVHGDPRALRSVLVNLVQNAARYAEGEHWIEIVARTVRLRPRGKALQLTVTNPVQRRPDPHPERLFDPFYRGRNAQQTGIAGTGIGLAVSRTLARRHGGGLSIDVSARGKVR